MALRPAPKFTKGSFVWLIYQFFSKLPSWTPYFTNPYPISDVRFKDGKWEYFMSGPDWVAEVNLFTSIRDAIIECDTRNGCK